MNKFHPCHAMLVFQTAAHKLKDFGQTKLSRTPFPIQQTDMKLAALSTLLVSE